MKHIQRIGLFVIILSLMVPLRVAQAGPPLKIQSPADGDTVSGTVSVTGRGDGTSVEVSISGGAWQAATGGKSWSYDWDTTSLSDGTHTLTAQYTDGSQSASITVTVSNGGGSGGGGSGGTAPTVGQVLINEFVAAPQSTQTTEWVELYNTTSSDLDLSGMWIDDIAAGGGSPQEIPAGTTIPAGGYYVAELGSFLNNSGDDVRLLSADQATVHDSYTYGSASYDKSYCRQPDGDLWKAAECEPTQGATNGGQVGGTWTPGTLEIHVLRVGQGETQLIIGPTGRTLLIGVYEASWNTNAGAQFVADEIRRITGSSSVDYVMPSHWHLDHMGYAGYGGIWSLLEEQGITAGKLIDRDGGVWNDANNDGICDPDLEVVWHNAGTVSGTARNWVCWATDPNTIGGQIRELAQIGSTTQIDLGLAEGVTVEIVQVDAEGVTMADGVTPLQGDHTGMTTPPSENDYSITLWINWGSFDYVAGGDTDGEYATSTWGYTYNDVETDVANRINQEVEAIWVNHHGSSHSSNPYYVGTLSPEVAAFSCGSTNTYGHPGQNVLDNFNAENTQMYFTEQCDPNRNYYNAIFLNDHILISTADGVNYTVNGDAYVATDPVTTSPTPTPTPTPTPEPTPTGPRLPAVGEVLINEYLPAPQSLTSEFIELYNTTSDELDIGGMWIDDLAGGGSSPQQIPAGTTIQPGGYYVLYVNSYLNNGGDEVNLFGTDGTTVFDATSYNSSSYDVSFCRVPDGGTWASGCTPTENGPN